MKPYVVKQGDYLEKIAHTLGFDADQVWNDGKNAELKQKRDPNLLCPGDILYVPDAEPVWLPVNAGSTNKYVAKIPTTKVSLAFKDDSGPFANEAYEILGMGAVKEGTTDGDGKLSVDVPVHVREIQVSFPKKQVIHPVRIGDMDPLDEPSGARKRLQHLGYGHALDEDQAEADTDAEQEVRDRLAILAFQHDNNLKPTGQLDDATRAALAKVHDA